jgi:glycosyltransferase involved in cell wall biosynthesis
MTNQRTEKSQLDSLISPEIKNDELYYLIEEIASSANIKNILEIGSSSGGGSTEAFVKGIQKNPHKPSLYCMEVSQVRFSQLQQTYAYADFVKCYNLSSVAIEDFPKKEDVVAFYNKNITNLNNYPLEEVLRWLDQDIEYIISSGMSGNGIEEIKRENNIDYFDLVLIDGSEFTGNVEFEEIYGAKIIILDDANSFKNYESHQKLLKDNNYVLVSQNLSLRNGYSIFKQKDVEIIFSELPINFFTIVLNGKPFIEYHIEVFNQLPFKWHWHIVEGVADLKHDTAWSLRLGGQVTDSIHLQGLSKDGTTDYIDELARLYPENVTIYRKPQGEFWDGKREMVQAPLVNIQEECLLWQVDVDELWTVEQIEATRQLFVANPDKTAAYYWCWYFVGEKLVVSTRNCYTQNPQQEWLRTWRFKLGYDWVAHEPPVLAEKLTDGSFRDIAKINPFLHDETENHNLLFQHYSYVLPEQLRFKESYYGYKEAESQWLNLQQAKVFPLLLREYLSWVTDQTMVDKTDFLQIVPIAQKDSETDIWRFLSSSEIMEQSLHAKRKKNFPIIAIDAVFFQLYRTGIARVWTSLLEEWAVNGFTRHILVLDRAKTAPKIVGIRYRDIPAYDYSQTEIDRQMLQQVCEEENIDLFISTYYTTPLDTPSVFMAYDMIPEVFGANFNDPMWREKHHGISHASSYISISRNTAQDLVKYFPAIPLNLVTVAHCGIKSAFSPVSLEEVNFFKSKYGISKSYFILVGANTDYKNINLFLNAFAQLPTKQSFEVVITTHGFLPRYEFRSYTSGSVVHILNLSDEELRIAYAGAIALVYPSKYEGFGLPVLEALACGCPVITCPNSSIPEVAGEAAIYVHDSDVNGMADALCEVQKPSVRQALISAGLEQAKKFSWSKMANIVSSALVNATLPPLNLRDINLIVFPDWSVYEEVLGLELAEVVKAIATDPNSSRMTLLINHDGVDENEANSLLSSVALHLVMEEDLEIPDHVEISLLGGLAEIQWKTLLPHIRACISIENENKENQSAIITEDVPIISILDINEISKEI